LLYKKATMTARLFLALYVGHLLSMITLLVGDSPLGWALFVFLFIAVFGGLFMIERPHIIAAAFLLVYLGILWTGSLMASQSARQQNWPTAPGVITRSWFCTRTVNGNTEYSGACIDYRYRVGEQTFEISSVDTREFQAYSLWWRIAGIPDSYQEGAEVKVFYNPDNPGSARLEPGLASGVRPGEWLSIGIGGVMSALALVTFAQAAFFRTDPSQIFVRV
jgi:hypothetical protein